MDEKLKDALARVESGTYMDEERFRQQEQEIQRLKQWVTDLQSGMFINCVYCGHRYGPSETTPATIPEGEGQPTMQEALAAHIRECPEHPLSKAMARLRSWEALVQNVEYDDQGLVTVFTPKYPLKHIANTSLLVNPPTPGSVQPMPEGALPPFMSDPQYDLCTCGDPRGAHEGGTGACNDWADDPGDYDDPDDALCPCQAFKLAPKETPHADA